MSQPLKPSKPTNKYKGLDVAFYCGTPQLPNGFTVICVHIFTSEANKSIREVNMLCFKNPESTKISDFQYRLSVPTNCIFKTYAREDKTFFFLFLH